MKRILTTLMTIMLMMGMAGSAETVYQEIPLPVSAQPTFYTCTDASGTPTTCLKLSSGRRTRTTASRR